MDERKPSQDITADTNVPEHDPDFLAAFYCFDTALDLIFPNLRRTDEIERENNLSSLSILAGLGTNDSDSLYHYTTAEGIQGIVEKGRFHASAAYYLNDSSEIDYGCEVLSDILKKRCSEKPGRKESLSTRMLRSVGDVFGNIGSMRNQLSKTYVVCFCEKPNLLSQWRAYGQSGGYSVGFSKEALGKFRAEGDLFQVDLKKVVYTKHDQKGILDRLIDDITSQLEKETLQSKFQELTEKGKGYCAKMCDSLLQRFALKEIVRFKHPAFEEEREWRIIAQPKTESAELKVMEALKFKASRGVPSPYIELLPDEGLLPITSVRYGPTLEKKRVEQALDVFFKKHGYSQIKVDGSEIPVRL